MELKFLIFFVLVTMTKSSGASESTNSCKMSTTEVEVDLAVNKFAEDTAHVGLERTNDLLYTQMKIILKQQATGNKTETAEYLCYPDDEEIQEETVTSLMMGITPALETMRTMNSDYNITAGYNRSYIIITELVKNFYYAMRLTCRTENYTKNRDEIDNYLRDAERRARALLGNLINAIEVTNFPPEIKPLIACAGESISSKILGAFRVVFYAIKALQEHLSKGTSAGNGNYLSVMRVARIKSSALFRAEVTEKYAMLRNLRIGIFLNETGIIPGLFALQSIQITPHS